MEGGNLCPWRKSIPGLPASSHLPCGEATVTVGTPKAVWYLQNTRNYIRQPKYKTFTWRFFRQRTPPLIEYQVRLLYGGRSSSHKRGQWQLQINGMRRADPLGTREARKPSWPWFLDSFAKQLQKASTRAHTKFFREPDQSCPNNQTRCFCKTHFNIIFPPASRSPKLPSPFRAELKFA